MEDSKGSGEGFLSIVFVVWIGVLVRGKLVGKFIIEIVIDIKIFKGKGLYSYLRFCRLMI